MALEAIRVAQRFADAVNAREAPEDVIAEDFLMENVATAVTDKVYRGREGVQHWMADLFEAYGADAHFNHEIVAATPHAVVSRLELSGSGSASGAPLELRWVGLIRIGGDRVTGAKGFMSIREALADAGLTHMAENVTLVRACTARWQELIDAADVSAGLDEWLAEYCAPDVWADFGTPTPGASPGRGHDVIRHWAADAFPRWKEADVWMRYEVERFMSVGDAVVAPATARGHVAGLDLDNRFTYLYRLKDAKIVSLTMHETLDEALASAG